MRLLSIFAFSLILGAILSCKLQSHVSEVNADTLAVSLCVPDSVEQTSDARAIVLTFPKDCTVDQGNTATNAAIQTLNNSDPRFFSHNEFRAYDANMVFIDDHFSSEGSVTVSSNTMHARIKDVVNYRIKVDGKKARYGQAWMSTDLTTSIKIKNWMFIEDLKRSSNDPSLGAGNEPDRQRINTHREWTLQWIRDLGDYVFYGESPDKNPRISPLTASIMEQIKTHPKVREFIHSDADDIMSTHSLDGQITNDTLVLTLTSR